mmetsp:Transcript_13268/g.24066  ORF Transcript_13268/g.24066 Transcript_13268/m.24066 type:complete len:235 (-) Transcript_13268:82-786(-)
MVLKNDSHIRSEAIMSSELYEQANLHPMDLQASGAPTSRTDSRIPQHQTENLEILRRRRNKVEQNYRQLSSPELLSHPSNRGDQAHSNDEIRAQHNRGSHEQSVLFSLVEIREYPRILGDNPSCRSGPPISLGWDYDKAVVVKVPIREFDEIPRQNGTRHFLLSRGERERILLDVGYTQSQIAQSVRQMIKIKKQRRQTINNLPVERFEEAVENWIRNAKKLQCYRKNPKNKRT